MNSYKLEDYNNELIFYEKNNNDCENSFLKNSNVKKKLNFDRNDLLSSGIIPNEKKIKFIGSTPSLYEVNNELFLSKNPKEKINLNNLIEEKRRNNLKKIKNVL